MNALLYKAKNAPLAYEDVALPDPADGQVRVRLKAAALNHRDNWITKGLYPHIRENIILGSDGCGEHEGREVILNPCLLYTSPSPRDRTRSRMPSSA